jgi:hypothetical protein
MADVGIFILAVIGAIYLGLTAAVMTGDHRRRAQDERYQDDVDFRRFVEGMKRLEAEDQDRAGDA